MEKSIKKNEDFWEYDDKGKVKIVQSKLIQFLNDSGFSKSEITKTNYTLVHESGNIVHEIMDFVIVDFVKNYLKKVNKRDVLDEFSKGVSTYISTSKLRLLNTIKLINDRDSEGLCWFYFKNICCQVGSTSISQVFYENLNRKIWANRIVPHDFVTPDTTKAQFESFCYNISGKDKDRFLALQTIMGYLMHRHYYSKEAKAIIFIDENLSFDGTANGGTGKSLLLRAIGKCREVVEINGKNIKENSWFRNQRVNRTSDVIFYDDVTKDFSLETLYSEITTGISVEKKYKAEEFIKPEDAPKICISSNYIVKGTGGSTDERRRCEFEVANYYGLELQPDDEFGNLFFTDWDGLEWSRFFLFMMGCVQKFLQNGLITPKPINLTQNRLINATCLEFVALMETGVVEENKWIEKKAVLELFIDEYPHKSNLSSHQLTKWFKEFSKQKNLKYEDRKSGEKFEFYLKDVNKLAEGHEKK